MKIDPISDFEKHHRKRIKPRRIDSNSSSQVNFSLESFYRKEFIEVLDTLITLMSSNLKCCLTSVQPLYNILSIPINPLITTEDIKNAFTLFPPSSDMSKVSDFDGSLCEVNILRQKTDDCKTLNEVIDISNKLKTVIPTANYLCRLAFTSPVSAASNERVFSVLKLIKNHLRTTMTDKRLNNLLILNTSKDILDNINMSAMIKNWATLKERRIIV